MEDLGYAVVTPARNEAAHLRRLADSLTGQALKPDAWVIVDDRSTDGTEALAAAARARAFVDSPRAGRYPCDSR